MTVNTVDAAVAGKDQSRASAPSTGPRVLVISPQPFFTPRGTPFSVYYRTLVMAQMGARVDLLTYGIGADVDIPGVRLVRIPRVPGISAVAVGPSFKKLLLDVLMILWTIGLLVRRRPDVVHAHEESVFWCRWLKPLFGFRLIYDMHSSLPQQLSNFKFSESKALIGIFKRLEDSALKASDAVITICPDLRDYALGVGVPEQRHFLIENSIFEDVRLKGQQPGTASASAANVNADAAAIDFTRPTIVYAGTFEAYQGIDIVVRGFAQVLREIPDAQLVLAGGTEQQVAEIRALRDSLGLTASCIMTGRVSKGEAMRFTREATVLVSPRIHGTNTPLKIYEQLASGRALVATRIWSHTQVLTEEVCVLVEPQPEDLARGLVRLLRDPALRQRLAANAQALYEREYARPIYERKIRALLELVS